MTVCARAGGLRCTKCFKNFSHAPVYECDRCEGILEVIYEYEGITDARLSKTRELMPGINPRVTLGEGNTSLIAADRLADYMGLENLYLKCETTNPTGSFKDRPVSVGMSAAIRFGYTSVIAASTGNGAASVAAYSARAGLNAFILVPESSSTEKILQARAYGALVITVIGGTYSDCYTLARQISTRSEYYNLTTTFYNPYTVDGNKAVGYEMYESTVSSSDSALIYVPIGAGPLLVGTYKGHEDYLQIYGKGQTPRMVGVQAEGNNPIVQAYRAGAEDVQPQRAPATIAAGIADGLTGYPRDGTYTLKYIRASGGFATDVRDDEITFAQKLLAEKEGLFVEPSGAAGVAAIAKDRAAKRISAADPVVAILTGHGLKDISHTPEGSETIAVPKDASELEKEINKVTKANKSVSNRNK